MSLRKPVAEATAPETELTELIRWIRDRKVMLDRDLARLYEVEVKVLNQAVKRNSSRFPDDFMFQLTEEEVESLRSRIVTLDAVVAGGPAGAAPVRGRGRHAKYDRQFKVVFDAIRQIMSPAPGSKRRIGFAPCEDEA
jgi:hypothetical protein